MTSQRASATTGTISVAILYGALALAAGNCAARGGPVPEPHATATTAAGINQKTSTIPKKTTSAGTLSVNNSAPTANADDKDINPFTGQSLSEAQLRRTLEREKLITAIASEKTKQTQSNSELQLARLRNVAEKSRFSSEVKVLSPVSVPAPSSRRTDSATPSSRTTVSSARPQFLAPQSHFEITPAPAPAPAPLNVARSTRAEIRFQDEIIELKSGPSAATNVNVIASVDAQRQPTAESTQPRPINPINVTPATLPPIAPPAFPAMVPAPQFLN
jgi:hypothetical protein